MILCFFLLGIGIIVVISIQAMESCAKESKGCLKIPSQLHRCDKIGGVCRNYVSTENYVIKRCEVNYVPDEGRGFFHILSPVGISQEYKSRTIVFRVGNGRFRLCFFFYQMLDPIFRNTVKTFLDDRNGINGPIRLVDKQSVHEFQNSRYMRGRILGAILPIWPGLDGTFKVIQKPQVVFWCQCRDDQTAVFVEADRQIGFITIQFPEFLVLCADIRENVETKVSCLAPLECDDADIVVYCHIGDLPPHLNGLDDNILFPGRICCLSNPDGNRRLNSERTLDAIGLFAGCQRKENKAYPEAARCFTMGNHGYFQKNFVRCCLGFRSSSGGSCI